MYNYIFPFKKKKAALSISQNWNRKIGIGQENCNWCNFQVVSVLVDEALM